MSLILDALRKMEQERKSRRQSQSDIRPDVLSYRGVPQKKTGSPRSLPVAVIGVVIVALVTGWFLLNKGETSPDALHRQTTEQAAPPGPVTPPPPQPQAQVPPAQLQPLPAPAPTTQPLPSAPIARELPPPVSEAAPSAGITISGIAWQDERSMRRAVINGSLVGEGAEVGGARVVEIRENRVRFTRNGQTFDVVYSSGMNN